MTWLTPHIGTQLVDLGSALLLLTCFAIVAQRRLSACVDLFALQSLFLAMTATLVAFLTDTPHIYFAAALTVLVKLVKWSQRELVMSRLRPPAKSGGRRSRLTAIVI